MVPLCKINKFIIKITECASNDLCIDYCSEKSSSPHVNPCLASRRRALGISLVKKPYVPQCEPDGTYTPLQCNVHTGVCWCVDIRGRERAGTRTKRTPNCCKYFLKYSCAVEHLGEILYFHVA